MVKSCVLQFPCEMPLRMSTQSHWRPMAQNHFAPISAIVNGNPVLQSRVTLQPGLTISFSGEIPVIGGNGIPFRNFGEFRRISVNFGRFFFNFQNEIFRKYRNIFSRYRAETKNFAEIRRNFAEISNPASAAVPASRASHRLGNLQLFQSCNAIPRVSI